MSEYRIYRLDRSGHRVGAAEVLTAPNDQAALEVVRAQGRVDEAEVREGPRLVAKISPPMMFRTKPMTTLEYLLTR
jgi:hypothetical protein